MRLILILLLTGFLGLFSLPDRAEAHGMGVERLDHGTGCADCPVMAGADEAGHGPQGCPHVTNCAAMALSPLALGAALPGALPARHGLPGARLLSGQPARIDLPPPRRA